MAERAAVNRKVIGSSPILGAKIKDRMTYFIHVVLAIILFIGGYQPYFWCQRRTKESSSWFRGNLSAIDYFIPLCPKWIWFYTLFYYPAIVLTVANHNDHDFIMIAFSYILMLAAMCSTYLLLPIKTPTSWRAPIFGNSLSERMLVFVRSIDGSNNCFPSGHAAVTVITAYHMAQFTGYLIALLWAISIHVSCLLCKQHYIIDLLAGASLGGLIIFFYRHFLI